MKRNSAEKTVADLSKERRIFLLILVSMGSSIIYTPAYLKNVFYDPLMESLGATNAQLGELLAAYAITATICYLPAGILADKIRVRTLTWVGFVATALLTFVYAMQPTYNILVLVFIGMGVTTILIWWGVRYKLVRLISTEEEYPRSIGFSYGIYGAAGLVVGMLNLWIISMFADHIKTGVTVLIAFLGVIILILGVLSYLFIPKFAGEIKTDGKSFNLSEFVASFKSPVVWMSALCMFFVYFYYTGVNYTTPYFSGVFGTSLGLVTFVGVVRTYGVTILSSPVFGWVAKRVGSPSWVIAIGSLMIVGGLLALVVLPTNASMALIAALIIVLLGFVANGVFGIVSSQLTEGNVPLHIFGAATGLLSVVGFLPDTFSSKWFGDMIDKQGNDAYPSIFLIMAGSAVIACVLSLVLRIYIKRSRTSTPSSEVTTAEATTSAGQ